MTAGSPAPAGEAAAPPRVVGLTGGLASGKSTVGKMLRARGAKIVDADEVARVVVEPGRPAYTQIVAAFGPQVLLGGAPDAADKGAAGTNPAQPLPPLDRARLAERVFHDPQARAQLNRITHPAIAAESARRIAEFGAGGAQVVIYEAALIVENHAYEWLAGLIVVDVPVEIQVERAVHRGGLTPEQARARIATQAPRDARLAVANWVIDSSCGLPEVEAQVDAVWAEIIAGKLPPRRGPAQTPTT